MKDISVRLESFRECVRHLWNTHFLESVGCFADKWALRDAFDDVCRTLFGCLVVEPLRLLLASRAGRLLCPGRNAALEVFRWLHVVPKTPAGVPIMINREPLKCDGYWDHPLQRVTEGDLDLRFVRWFDFDELGFRDFRYYLVRIDSAAREDIVGRAALIDCEYASVLLDENDLTAPP